LNEFASVELFFAIYPESFNHLTRLLFNLHKSRLSAKAIRLLAATLLNLVTG
jgi:hypothetical protein